MINQHGALIDDASYRSFMVRLWREAGSMEPNLCGEVEHIQSGAVITVSSLKEVYDLIGRTVAGDQGDNLVKQ